MSFTGIMNLFLPCTNTTSSLPTKVLSLSCCDSGRLPPSYFIGVITPTSFFCAAANPGLTDNKDKVKQRTIEMYGVCDFMKPFLVETTSWLTVNLLRDVIKNLYCGALQ